MEERSKAERVVERERQRLSEWERKRRKERPIEFELDEGRSRKILRVTRAEEKARSIAAGTGLVFT